MAAIVLISIITPTDYYVCRTLEFLNVVCVKLIKGGDIIEVIAATNFTSRHYNDLM
jgi:hypothetical protein